MEIVGEKQHFRVFAENMVVSAMLAVASTDSP
jgi:hypothetical protein